jgi:dTDP-4-amino-4,6-dideoxygalactose transaminase
MHEALNRRRFVTATAAAGFGLALGGTAAAAAEQPAPAAASTAGAAEKPALLGGKPVRTRPFPAWPRMDSREDKALLDVLHSGKWFRGEGQCVNRFEAAYAQLTGAKHCLATANGTSALFASLGALGIGPGDEVLLTPYTFVATLNVVLLHYALPIFVDIDPETFQIDARKIEAAITARTAAILPVHIGGSVADMDTILAVAAEHKLPVVEDACQAHLAEWRGRKAGTLGTTGCFSFQITKNLCAGEGGAILTDDEALAGKCYAFHNNCRPRAKAGYNFGYVGGRGANLRMTEFQGALLLAQMTRLEEQSNTRRQNAEYLTGMLREIPGITPARTYAGCTRNAYHLFMLRYDARQFAGLPRAKFIAALNAEGIPCFAGYAPLNQEAFLKGTIQSRAYQKIYSKAEIDRWEERTQCPLNERLCQEGVWMAQAMFLGPRSDMDEIAAAVRKIQGHAAALAKA